MLRSFKLLDLTHVVRPEIPTWTGSCGFSIEIKQDYDKGFRAQQLKMHASAGTHMDAPSHVFKGGLSIAELPFEQFIKPAYVIDVSDRAKADYEISVHDLKEFEKAHGQIAPDSLVIGYTGWSRHWTNPRAYINQDANGQRHFPAFSKDAGKFLLDRDIAGLGIDTLSPDCLDMDYPVHRILLRADRYILENIADCSKMPPKGSYVIALPLKGHDCAECPTRIVALVPR